jgi:NADPH-dependent curcumin reductase CurA
VARAPGGSAEPAGPALERGYARGRARDEAARAALEPLRPGERPTAVTVGAVVAGGFAIANLVALVAGWDTTPGSSDDRGAAIAGSLLVAGLLCLVAYGMWKARYWAVLGMQTLLAITIVISSLALVTATSAWAAVLLVAIACAAGALFWFLVKAMARIQMPERPGRR